MVGWGGSVTYLPVGLCQRFRVRLPLRIRRLNYVSHEWDELNSEVNLVKLEKTVLAPVRVHTTQHNT